MLLDSQPKYLPYIHKESKNNNFWKNTIKIAEHPATMIEKTFEYI